MAERKQLKREVLKPQVAQARKPVETRQPETDDVAQLQRQLGNQAVQRLMKQGRLQLSGATLQAKLTVTAAGDQYEQEADRVAQQVVQNTASSETAQRAGEEDEMALKRVQRDSDEEEMAMQRIQRAGDEEELAMQRIQRADEEEEMALKRIQPIQRAGEEDEMALKRVQRDRDEEEMAMQRIQRADEEEEMALKRDDPADGFDVDGGLEQTIQTERGSGQSMGNQTRGAMEKGFGQDFSGVHVHTDQKADELNQSLSARAFTIGSDIFFRSGEYNPDASAGKELLAHELTHVVQQGASVQKKREDD